jgi:hypothetical protein
MKKVEHIAGDVVVFEDYPTGKFARKIDWWTSKQGLELIASWRSCGCSIDDITKKIGVDPRTFRAWRKKCPQLEEVLVSGKEITNARIVDALYKRATGFEYDEITRELVEGEMRVTKIVTKYVPPETKAILAWLYNRQSESWRAIQQPIDMDTPALTSADDMLVTIREAAEKVTEGHGSGSDAGDGQEGLPDFEGEGEATGGSGGVL